MLLRLSNLLHRIAKGWVAISSLLILLVFTMLVLPAQTSRSKATSGGAGTPDLSFYYSADELYQMAEAYGSEGRQEYVRARFTFDLIWPVVYTLFLVAGIGWLYQRAFEPGTRWQLGNVVPVIGALFDYLENIATSLVMLRYPAATPVVDVVASLFTILKWTLVGGSFILLIIGLAKYVWLRLKGR